MILGIDIGGTFTDFVLFDGKNYKIDKVLSTPDNPAEAIFDGLNRIREQYAVDNLNIVHGSTVATNSLLERKGAKVALVTTKGYEDIIEIGRQNRRKLYDLFITRDPVLAPRSRRWGISERSTADGKIIQNVKKHDLETIKKKIKRYKVDSVAICFLFSYKNSKNENDAYEILKELGIHISSSHKIVPEYREYERFITTIVNAYVSPIMSKYLSSLEDGLEKESVGNLKIMQSNGGSISTIVAKERAVNCILSGPAGGVIGASKIAKCSGRRKLISFDMGGTSTDVSLCDGDLRLTTETLINDLPIKTPLIDIYTVGAGGGSIAYIGFVK